MSSKTKNRIKSWMG